MRRDENERDALDKLAAFMFDPILELPAGERAKELMEYGVDLDELSRNASNMIESLRQKRRGQMRLQEAKEHLDQHRKTEGRRRKIYHLQGSVRERIESFLAIMKVERPEEAGVYNRKFTETPPEDLESLCEDLEELLEQDNQ